MYEGHDAMKAVTVTANGRFENRFGIFAHKAGDLHRQQSVGDGGGGARWDTEARGQLPATVGSLGTKQGEQSLVRDSVRDAALLKGGLDEGWSCGGEGREGTGGYCHEADVGKPGASA